MCSLAQKAGPRFLLHISKLERNRPSARLIYNYSKE